jgi:uncharacterized membrane protein YjfL (UPF0719 family)
MNTKHFKNGNRSWAFMLGAMFYGSLICGAEAIKHPDSFPQYDFLYLGGMAILLLGAGLGLLKRE